MMSTRHYQVLLDTTFDKNLFHADMEKMLYINESKKAVVDKTQQKV